MFGKSSGPRQVNYLWVLAGGYLAYLGINLLKSSILGQSSNPVLFTICAILFLAVGGAVILREWKLYRYGPQTDDSDDELDSDSSDSGVFDTSDDGDEEDVEDAFLEELVSEEDSDEESKEGPHD